MKTIIIIILLTANIIAQTEYPVEPGTRNNEIILSVVNESEISETNHLNIRMVSNPLGIEMTKNAAEIEKLARGDEQEVSFVFNAKRVPGTKKDTLKFVINDINGDQWEKKIVLAYSLPTEFKLEQNYPNPFNPSTTIGYQLPQNCRISLKIIDILGREVVTLVDDIQEAGYYEKKFDAGNLSSGIYFSLLRSEKTNLVKKMLLLK